MSIFNTKPYLAAISGGPDSIALLNMYHKHIKVVCTIKYNKRQDCYKDVECVKMLCDKYKIPFELLDVNDQIYEKYNSDSNFQLIARKIRYDFFAETAKKYNVKKILMAHHLDDFLETAYLEKQKNSKNLFYGIPKNSRYKELEIVRPLINLYRKKTLQRYCDDLNLPYNIDITNESDEYERNRTRKIIELMSGDQVYKLLKEIRKHNKFNKKKQKEINKKFILWEQKQFDLNFFKAIEQELKYYLIYQFLYIHQIYRPSSNKVYAIIEFIEKSNGKEYRVKENYKIIKQDNYLKII